MSDMKCPFCQTELEINDLDVQLLGCENQNCKHSTHYDIVGTKELWQALIQSQKDLGKLKERYSAWKKKVLDWQMEVIMRNAELKIAKNALRQIESKLVISPEIVARKALEQIEQKEEHDGIPL